MRTVTCIEESDFDGYVYDMSTRSGTFSVSAVTREMPIHLKNTDSVYVRWKGARMEDAFRLSSEAAEFASQSFPSPILLEFEKVMCPLALYTKKRYSFQMWENPESPCKALQHVGTQVIRRDTCLFVRSMLSNVLELIIKRNDVDAALQHSRLEIERLLTGEVSMQELTLSRQYKDTYKNPNIPHVRLAERLRQRKDVNQVRPGDRVSFVMIDHADGIETPEYTKERGLPIDVMMYFDKQLKTPLDMIWGLVMEPEKVYTDLLERSKRKSQKEKALNGYLRLFHRAA